MLRAVNSKPLAAEGYVYVVYGDEKYLRHAVASVVSLRRHDPTRPAALLCEQHHKELLDRSGLGHLFDVYVPLQPEHRSIVGFKHNVHRYLVFERNMFLDSDIIWCKNPNALWNSFSPYPFTITGTFVSDPFFGARKDGGIIFDIILNRRKRTLKKFGLTYLSRVQSGMIFAQDHEMTRRVCQLASDMLNQKADTHFRSRTLEAGRSEESCEWSLAMALSRLDVPVFPWLQGHTSPQLDFIEDMTEFDPDFEYVRCRYYSNPFVYSLRGIQSSRLRNMVISVLSLYPGNGDFMMVTPYCLHFGWYHQKQPFNRFADRNWHRLTSEGQRNQRQEPVRRIAADAAVPAF